MKKSLFLLILCTVLLSSCNAKANAPQDELQTVISHINRQNAMSYHVKNEFTDEDFYVGTQCHLAWPKTVMNVTSPQLQQALIDVLTGEPGKFSTLDQALAKLLDCKNHILADTDAVSNFKAIPSVPEDAGMNQSYYQVDLSPMRLDENQCVFKFFKDIYQGGAHGMQWERYVNYDPKEDKVIQLTDLVTDTVRLCDVITTALLEMEGVESFSQLDDKGYLLDGATTVPLTYTFYLEGNCVHFVYDPYEIACYARGIVDVEVTFYLLEQAGIASDYFRKLCSRLQQ